MPPKPRFRIPAAAALVALILGAPGCTTVSSLNSAARNLDTYELSPLPPQPGARAGSRLLFVAEATAPGAIGSDRIVIKPNPLQVTLLGDGRWVEAAPTHIRNVIARSFANTGRFAFVTTAAVGPLPDFTLLTDVDGFEAQILPPGGAAGPGRGVDDAVGGPRRRQPAGGEPPLRADRRGGGHRRPVDRLGLRGCEQRPSPRCGALGDDGDDRVLRRLTRDPADCFAPLENPFPEPPLPGRQWRPARFGRPERQRGGRGGCGLGRRRQSGRACLGWRVADAPARGRQARPDLSTDKSGK